MFKISKDNFIESDEGFEVKVLAFTGTEVKYIQEGKSLIIGSERLTGPYSIVIFASGIKKWDSGEPIDESARTKIVDNVVRALTWNGGKVKVRYDRNQVFTKPKPNIIESVDGFSVEKVGQTELKYVQNGKTVVIYSEMLTGSNNIKIKAKSIKSWASGEPIDVYTEATIINNLVRALAWEGTKVIVTLRN